MQQAKVKKILEAMTIGKGSECSKGMLDTKEGNPELQWSNCNYRKTRQMGLLEMEKANMAWDP